MPQAARRIDFDSRRDWLAWKEGNPQRFGASKIAAILGQSAYGGRYEEWAARTGKYQRPPIDPERAEAGLELEESVLRWYARRRGFPQSTVETFPTPSVLIHPTDDIAYCSPDCLVNRGEDSGGCDAKTHGARFGLSGDPLRSYGEEGSDLVPIDIWWQVQWSAGCDPDRRKWWDVAALFAGDKIRLGVYRVHHDPKLTADAREVVRDFYTTHVLGDVPPEADYAELGSIEQALRSVYRDTIQEVVPATPVDVGLLVRLRLIEQLSKALEEESGRIREYLMNRLAKREAIVLPGAGPRGKDVPLLTFKKGADRPAGWAADWEMTARALAEEIAGDDGDLEETLQLHLVKREIPAKDGSRSFLPKIRGKSADRLMQLCFKAGLVDLDSSMTDAGELIDAVRPFVSSQHLIGETDDDQ